MENTIEKYVKTINYNAYCVIKSKLALSILDTQFIE